ncbi:hypothetical protein RB195_025980 [Necator americanus]|uniref:Uncharacterized protein n=1 Tax=Necator americanus TaxID=51031 RepID=A0ABR1EX24_NECAM
MKFLFTKRDVVQFEIAILKINLARTKADRLTISLAILTILVRSHRDHHIAQFGLLNKRIVAANNKP